MLNDPLLLGKIEQWKSRLVDTSKRNRLLYFKPSKRGTVRLLEPSANVVFDSVVRRGRVMEFAAEEPIEDASDLAEPDLLVEDTLRRRQRRQNEPLTDLLPKELWRTLYSLRQRSRESVAEKGIVSLHLAIGFLEWMDADSSTDVIRSPLVLVPMNLFHGGSREPYKLHLFEQDAVANEDVVINPTLAYKLKNDFGLTIPKLPGIESLDIDDYLDDLRSAISAYPRWRVTSDVYLGLFSFLKINMYKDLSTHAERAAEHPILRALAGDSSQMSGKDIDPPLADQLDIVMRPIDTFEVVESDSSQQEAIQAAKAGLTFVLQGPPGTGKSQTITNIIAECLATEKKVLFVSEKMAALDVVHKRLTQNGLGDFCLEAHSHKANKRAIIDELGRTLSANKPEAPSVEAELTELSRLKNDLNDYAAALHRPREPFGKTAFQVHGELAQVMDAPDLLFGLPELSRMTFEDSVRVEGLLARIQALHHVMLGYTDSLWRDIVHNEFTLELRQDISAHLDRLALRTSEATLESSRVATLCGVSQADTLSGYRQLLALAALLQGAPPVPEHWLRNSDLRPLIDSAQNLAEQFQWYRDSRKSLLRTYHVDLFERSQGGFAEKLASASKAVLSGLKSSNVSLDRVVDEREKVGEVFRRAEIHCESLLTAATALVEETGLSNISSVESASSVCAILKAVSADIRPTRRWLDEATFATLASKISDARQRFGAYRETRSKILTDYREEVLRLDSESMLARFAGDYDVFWRPLLKSYWSDLGILKACRNAGGKLTYPDAMRDLRTLRVFRELEDWVQGHDAELSDLLGAHYSGIETDWAAAAAAVESFKALVEMLPGRALPARLGDCMVAAGEPLQALSKLRNLLEKNLLDIDKCLQWLGRAYAVDSVDPENCSVNRADLNDVRSWLISNRDALERLGEYRDSAKACMIDPGQAQIAPLIEAARSAAQLNNLEKSIDARVDQLSGEYGALFSGMQTNWDEIFAALKWAGDVLCWFGEDSAPESLIEALSERETLISGLSERLPSAESLADSLETEIRYFDSLFLRPKFPDATEATRFDELLDIANRCRIDLPGLNEWLQFRHLEATFRHQGLDSLMDVLLAAQPLPHQIIPAYRKRLWHLWLDAAYGGEDALKLFRGDFHASLVDRFRQLDTNQFQYARARLRARLAKLRPNQTWGTGESSEVNILRREVQKQRQHKSVRLLFGEIPFLLQSLKPCLLMSPLSVAQFLDPTKVEFDVVIFDEASQICPEDAVGSIMRGKQLVVVGDSKQLPPTQFFMTSEAEEFDDDNEIEEPGEEAGQVRAKQQDIVFDSILEECTGAGFPSKMLHWHYRSRCESLIAFSNQHFYNNDLVTFPNPFTDAPSKDEICVDFVHVPDGVYVRGRVADAGTNRNEAMRIADMVIDHFKNHPKQSLGVIAFSQAQQTAIDDAIRLKRRQLSYLDHFFSEEKHECFFVKNLENVQGDERDVIFFSVGYAKDAAGRMLMNFGPLTKSGGERRLNVAVTRAKHRVRLVASIQPHDIDPSRTSSQGALLLQKYLQFAQQGVASLARETTVDPSAEADSVFEAQVAESLERAGLIVRRQIGCSGYRIDLAVIDPDRLGRYILGIECDGATYHSSKTARDRDRLRQTVLEGLDWHIMRIWSTDWIKNPGAQVQRVVDAVAKLRQAAADMPRSGNGYESESPAPGNLVDARSNMEPNDYLHLQASGAESSFAGQLHSIAPTRQVSSYQPYQMTLQGSQERFYEIAETNSTVLQIKLSEIVATEGPIHIQVATRRLVSGWGMTRAGAKLLGITRSTARLAERNGSITIREDFLWPVDMDEPPVRTSGGRGIDEIAMEELEQALVAAVCDAYGIERDDLIRQVARMLGFDRVGTLISRRIGLAIEAAVQSNRIRLQDNVCWPVRK